MSTRAGALIRKARQEKRPRWSQQFLSNEASARGLSVSRAQISRLESGNDDLYNCELVIALGIILDLPRESVAQALFDDLDAVYGRLQAQLAPRPSAVPPVNGATPATPAIRRHRRLSPAD